MSTSTDWYSLRFQGIEALGFGLQRLQAAHVCVIGIGGVGSWAVESLARSGIGRLTLVDLDEVCVSNTNRQIHALSDSVGKPKVEVMAARLQQINPDIIIHTYQQFVKADNVDALLNPPSTTSSQFSVVLEAVDNPSDKAAIVASCCRVGLQVVSVGASGGKSDPTEICVADFTEAFNDRLIFQTRKTLRRDYGFSSGPPYRTPLWNIPVVFSKERGKAPLKGKGSTSCDSSYGTASFVTGGVGFAAASVVVKMVCDRHFYPFHEVVQANPHVCPSVNVEGRIATQHSSETIQRTQH